MTEVIFLNEKKYSILIPSYKPDERLIELCNDLYSQNISDVLIVDDGSGNGYSDIYDRIQREFRYKVIFNDVNQGKGRTLKNGMSFLLEDETVKGCITADADGQHCAEDIVRCLDLLEICPENVIIGVRDFDDACVPISERIWNKATRTVFAYIYGTRLNDTLCGLRGLPRSFMELIIDAKGERYDYEINVLIEATKGREITEFPIKTIIDEKGHFTSRDKLEIYKIFGSIFLTFMLSSLSSSLIDLALFSILCRLFRVALPLTYVICATVLARIVSATYNYLVNRKVVFKNQSSHSKSGLKFLILTIAHTLVSAFAVTGLVNILPNINETILKAMVDLILFFASYPIQQKYVFGDRTQK